MAIYLFKGKSKLERSHIGQIIMSTTLNTQAKVIEQYGGTTWTKIEGRFLLGASSSYPVNATGGEATHTLTINEMPTHNHNQAYEGSGVFLPGHAIAKSIANRDANNAFSDRSGEYYNDGLLSDEGGGQAHNNMPPYKAVYIWERTA